MVVIMAAACGAAPKPGVVGEGGSARSEARANHSAAPLTPVDILIFAPHPDDEVIGCAGIIQRAVAAGKSVRVSFATLGDGFAHAAAILLHKEEAALGPADYLSLARVRQQETIDAARVLGVSPANIVFLGYPDGALDRVAATTDNTPVTSLTTGRSSTYGIVVPDYHTRAHGRAAPYTRAAVLADVVEVLQQSRPSAVYVTSAKDTHADHMAMHDLVKDAIAAIGYSGALSTFVVHSGPPWEWPWPQGSTPQLPFQQHTSGGTTYPVGAPWPPSVRVPLTSGEVAVKLRALGTYHSQWVLPHGHDLLASFIKSEEIFWTDR